MSLQTFRRKHIWHFSALAVHLPGVLQTADAGPQLGVAADAGCGLNVSFFFFFLISQSNAAT